MRKIKITRIYTVLAVVAVSFTLLQFFNRPLAAKPVTSEIEAPEEVLSVLKRSCYSCHSNQPQLSWYDKIAPASWLVKKDVERAREVMNFSEWDNTSADAQEGRMYGILNMMKARKMPLGNYTLLHPEAKISDADVAVIERYTLSLSAAPKESKATVAAAPSVTLQQAPVSPNGVPYTDEFKKWKVISMSTLFDNSMRVIFGNDIAVKAVEEENFHPWPDGSIVVKAVWEQVENEQGDTRPGKFINAQFMVKDGKSYKDTEGWGFAKFSGPGLAPTGKTALFAQQSCISCHRQLAEPTGYLFDVPLKSNFNHLVSKISAK